MLSPISIMGTANIKDISDGLLDEKNKLKLLSFKEYEKYSWEQLRLFCHYNARYGLPTQELISWLKVVIDGRKAIEIGAGSGDLGSLLEIHMTDNKQQSWENIKEHYKQLGQPTISYPCEIEEIDALDAVKKHKPKVVIASWVTTYSPHQTRYASSPYGVKEDEILDLVDTYIHIGNLSVHGHKPILKNPHEEIKADWILSRSVRPDLNCIFLFNK